MFDRPRPGPVAGMHEFDGKPVEQRGVSGLGTAVAKIVGSGNDPLAKMMLPDSVHGHACSERITWIGNPFKF